MLTTRDMLFIPIPKGNHSLPKHIALDQNVLNRANDTITLEMTGSYHSISPNEIKDRIPICRPVTHDTAEVTSGTVIKMCRIQENKLKGFSVLVRVNPEEAKEYKNSYQFDIVDGQIVCPKTKATLEITDEYLICIDAKRLCFEKALQVYKLITREETEIAA